MKSITVETAILAEAVSRAARIAPNKGAAFDKASGILLEVRPSSTSPLRVKATDLEVTFWQRVPVIEAGDENADWRVPSVLLNGVISGLPNASGTKVTIVQEDGANEILIKCGRRKSRLRLINSPFPELKPFDPAGLTPVADFAKRVSQAAWAVHSENPPLSGVHVSGEHLVACDRIRLVFVPCEVPVEKPVTVPLTPLVALLKSTSEVRIGADDRRLLLMPDDDTQMTAVIYEAAYPKVEAIRRDDFRAEFKVNKTRLVEAIQGMLVLVKSERYPKLRLEISEGSLLLRMRVDEVGLMEDLVDIDGGELEGNPAFVMWFSPTNLLSAVSNGNSEIVTVQYGPDLKPVHVVDDADYDCWLMPLRVDE